MLSAGEESHHTTGTTLNIRNKRTHHLVDGFDDSEHLFVTDLSIPIYVVELECPVEFILHFATTSHTEGAYKLFKINSAALVRVKDLENIICKGIGIAKGKELSVDFLEFLLGESTRRAIFQEP